MTPPLPPVSVAPDSATAPFEQIRSQLAGLIDSGALAEGERLPTVRGLAGDLGVAVNTVARAYRELEADGLVVTAGRAGTVVAPGAQRDEVALQRAAAALAERATLSRVPEHEALELVREAFRRLRS
jgi:GntR family transcriptional regulator